MLSTILTLKKKKYLGFCIGISGLLHEIKPNLLSLQGLSFLDLRYHLLLFYLQDITHLISIKTVGGKIKESEALNRVVTIRTVR